MKRDKSASFLALLNMLLLKNAKPLFFQKKRDLFIDHYMRKAIFAKAAALCTLWVTRKGHLIYCPWGSMFNLHTSQMNERAG